GSTGNAIDLAGSITGTYTSVAIATGPSHGMASLAGTRITYTPTTGYVGTDSIAITATGPGGPPAPALLSITITATAPVAANDAVTTPANQQATVAVTANDTGLITAIALGSSKPQHGTASVSGLNIVYVPTANYFGADSFTYTASGPGGTSAAAT